EIRADKLICIIDGPILDDNGHLIRFLPLDAADELIRKRATESEVAATYVKAVSATSDVWSEVTLSSKTIDPPSDVKDSGEMVNARFQNGVGFNNGNGVGFPIGGRERLGRLNGYLSELAAASFVCRGGVQRVHLLDGTVGGALLLELYQRDGMGTMVASDLYEGTRAATKADIPGIRQIMLPLEDSGVLVQRSDQEVLEKIDSYVVMERDGHIIASGALFIFPEEKCAEVAAIAVAPECRGQGQGDKLLDYMEKKVIAAGLQMLFLLTTRTVDWFVRRGFVECSIELLPLAKREKINLARKSKYYMKKLKRKDK
uniref:N-acetyltransferase domain-containing protein n=1 Tax=Kalanchoe fedtschenkoi TaxID=63787 RepID=A0A7N0VKY1_KALFE